MKRFLIWSLLLGGLLVSGVHAESDPRIVRPSGVNELAYLKLEAEGDDKGPAWMVVRLREGRGAGAWLPLYAPAVDASGLRLIGGKLSGAVMDQGPAHKPGIRFVYTLDAKIDGGRITGSWTRTKTDPGIKFHDRWSPVLEPASGTLVGELRSSETLKKEQDFTQSADWATWLGPNGDRSAAETDVQLIDDPSRARPVWKSEGLISAAPGRANDIPRHGVKSLYNTPSGGGATPIVAEGKVFLNFYLPSGDAYDKNAAKIYTEQLSRETNQGFFRDNKLPTLVPLKVAADDVVIAVDAATGALIWRTTFPGGGANHTSHKNDLNNLSVVVADRRVYAIGSTMRLRCLDSHSGELLWEQPLGPVTTELEKQRDEGVQTGKWIKKRNRDWGSSPIVLDGMVISADMSQGVVAFDAKSGEQRWRTEKVAWKNSHPHVWTGSGTSCLIVVGLYKMSCLNAADGSVRWSIPANAYRGVTVSGNLLAYRDDVGPPDTEDRNPQQAKDPANRVCVVMELGLDQPKLLWHMKWNLIENGQKVKGQYSDYVRPQIDGGRLYLSGAQWTDCFDTRTGKKLAHLKAQGGVFNAGHLLIAHGRLFSVVDGKHGTTRMAMYTTDPKDFRPTGPDAVWVPPHPNTTSYGPCMLHPVVDGRIFIRGHDAIYCYDLRVID